MVSYANFRNPTRPEPEREPLLAGCTLPVIDPVKEEKYRAILEAQAKELVSVRFGGFWEENPKESPPGGYDKDYFVLQAAERGEGLMLIKGKAPSEAMQAILKHPEKWRLDCSAFTHVILGLARLDCSGKKKFDQVFEGRLFFFSQMSDSFTVKGVSFVRDDPDYKLIMRTASEQDCGANNDSDDEALFQMCPVGTLFIFRNGDVDPMGRENYRFEHTIRLGPDSFIAHALVNGKNIVSLKELREGLASRTFMAHGKPGESFEQYARRVVWIRAAFLLNTHLIEKS